MKPTRQLSARPSFYAVAIVTAAFGAAWHLWPEPARDVYEICAECGLDREEADELIAMIRGRRLTADQELALWRQIAGENADLCEPCAAAAIEAAGPD